MRYLRDVSLVVFAAIALAVLIVSAPASYRLIALYHSDGTIVGIVSAWALLCILEAGAVAAKIATLWAPGSRRQLEGLVLAMLGINTLSNWIHGAAVAQQQGLRPVTAWLGALIYAAALPALLWLMLQLLVARVELLRGYTATIDEEAAQQLRPVAHAVALANAAQRSLSSLYPLPRLPAPEALHARPDLDRSQPALMPQTHCPRCGAAARPRQLANARQHSGWRCACGFKVGLVGPDELQAQP